MATEWAELWIRSLYTLLFKAYERGNPFQTHENSIYKNYEDKQQLIHSIRK